MYIGICMSGIDHDRNTRNEARAEALKLRKEFGLNSVELVIEGIGRRYAPYPWEWEEAELREVEHFLSHFEHTGAHLPFYNMNVIAVNERVREDAMEQMRQAIEVAKRLNLNYAVAHATGTTEGTMTEREPHRQHLAFKRLAGFCEGSGLTLSIENATNLHNIEACANMIRTLKKEGLPVAMTFDTGHANISSWREEPPYLKYGSVADALTACADILNNIHLHNNDGSGDQHRSLLEGTIDLKACITRLRDLDYQGSVSIEVRPGQKGLAGDIALLLEWCGR